MRSQRLRYRAGPRNTPTLATLRLAYSAAPFAVSAASGLLLVLGVADMIAAPAAATAGIFVLAGASIITFAVALEARNERAFLASVLLISAASAFADLPVHRADAAVLAAVAGATVLCIIEAGGAALEPNGGGSNLGRPARLHVAWVAAVAPGGAAAGWLLLSLQPDLDDLGLVALGLGVLAAVGMIVFAGALARSALADAAGDDAAGSAAGSDFSQPLQRAPSPRGRRLARGTRRAPRGRPPR
jgi:hypothetical protein